MVSTPDKNTDRASDASPPYWGTLEGEIIKAIVSARVELTLNELKEKTSSDEESLYQAISKLYSADAVFKVITGKEEIWRVSPRLWHSYKNYLHSIKCKKELEDWINQWKTLKKLDLTLDCDQFFLEGRHLDDFTKELISNAKSSVLVVNPFVEYCDLSNTLVDARKRGISVQIITRQPQDYYQDKLKKKQEYLSQLAGQGVDVQFNNKVHAKIVVVDSIIAIVSSMNFYPDSSAGASWEAGLISFHSMTVDSILNSIKIKTLQKNISLSC
jgi:hypothetical protein